MDISPSASGQESRLSYDKSMKKNNVYASDAKPVSSEPSGLRHESREPRRNGRNATLWFGLLLILPLAIGATERLRAKVASEARHCSPRVGWYFQSGQWLADVRTFAAACQFVTEGDADATGRDSSPGIQLAKPESEATPDTPSVVGSGQPPQSDS